MTFFGKILGVFFGFLFGGPLGALLGLFLGHQFDKARRLNQAGYRAGAFSKGANQAEKQAEFFRAAFAVMGHVAKAKGQVTKEEIQLASVLMEKMQLNSEQKKAAQEAFREGKSSDFPLNEVLQKVRLSAGRFDLLQFFLELQISAAFADGELHPSERAVLHTIAKGLGFSSQQLEQRLQMQQAAFRFHGGTGGWQHSNQQYNNGSWQQAATANKLSDAYDVLGVSENADSKEIKKAYRKLMNEHHPDKLVAKGLPPEMMEVAKEKAQQIQSAYDLIKREKG